MKRKKLMVKKQVVENTEKKDNPLKKQKNFYSGFCLTDNKNYAFFNIQRQFLVDNDIVNVLSFNLRDEDLQMIIDKSNTLKPSIGGEKVFFTDLGLVDRKLYDFILDLYPSCLWYKVIKWFNKNSNRLIVALNDQYSKPLVMLKTIK